MDAATKTMPAGALPVLIGQEDVSVGQRQKKNVAQQKAVDTSRAPLTSRSNPPIGTLVGLAYEQEKSSKSPSASTTNPPTLTSSSLGQTSSPTNTATGGVIAFNNLSMLQMPTGNAYMPEASLNGAMVLALLVNLENLLSSGSAQAEQVAGAAEYQERQDGIHAMQKELKGEQASAWTTFGFSITASLAGAAFGIQGARKTLAENALWNSLASSTPEVINAFGKVIDTSVGGTAEEMHARMREQQDEAIADQLKTEKDLLKQGLDGVVSTGTSNIQTVQQAWQGVLQALQQMAR